MFFSPLLVKCFVKCCLEIRMLTWKLVLPFEPDELFTSKYNSVLLTTWNCTDLIKNWNKIQNTAIIISRCSFLSRAWCSIQLVYQDHPGNSCGGSEDILKGFVLSDFSGHDGILLNWMIMCSDTRNKIALPLFDDCSTRVDFWADSTLPVSARFQTAFESVCIPSTGDQLQFAAFSSSLNYFEHCFDLLWALDIVSDWSDSCRILLIC